MRCCVHNCFNDDSKKTNKSRGITFHKLPKDPDHSAAWLSAVVSLGCRMNKCLVVCSEHFLSEDFDDTRPNQRRVKSGAVPTIMAPVIQDELKVCRVCLALDVKMYDMKDSRLSEMFQNITGISAIHKKSNILQRVCWECAARLTAAAAFRDKALLSDALLKGQVHIKESDIAVLKQNHNSLKSPLSVKTTFNSYDIECEHNISEHKEILISLNDKTDINERKPEMRIIEEEKEIEFEQYEAWIDVPVKTEIESDPIADNTLFQDRKSDNFSDSFTYPREHCEYGITNTEVQINNNDKIVREDTQKKFPYINDAGNIVLVDKEKKNKLDLIGNNVEESSSEEDTQTIAEEVSVNKSKQTMSSEVGASNKRVRRMYKLNERIKEKIIALKNNGLSVSAIANETGMSTSSISCWWRRYRKNGNTFRRSTITGRDECYTKQNYCYNPSEPGKELEPCPTIVRQRLREAGLEHILMKKPERNVDMGQKTRRMYKLNERIKEKIIALKNNGLSVSAIANETGMSTSSISCWWRRYRKNGNTFRRSTITGRDECYTKQNYCYNPSEPGKELEPCPTIVRQRLREAGLEHILMKKPERNVDMGQKTSTRKALHEDLKQRIIALKQEGMSNSRIAYLLNTARNTVHKWWNRWCNEGHMQNHKQPGRKRKTTPEEDQLLIDRVAQEQTVHTPSLAKEFGISLKCLTNRLKEAGFKNKTREAYVPLKAGRTHKVDEEVKQQIISLKLNGVSVTDIANQFRVPRTTIYQWWQRWCKENNIKITSDNNASTTTEQEQSLAEDTNVERIVQTPSIMSSQKSLWQKVPDV